MNDLSSKTLRAARLDRRGAAMTETALLCFFLYAPVLMMVIIWGDLNLDKARAHAATAYMAFARDPIDDSVLVGRFFPAATGQSDPTFSVRSVAVEADDLTEGPIYTLPNVTGADYSGDPPPFDLQYKLWSLAAGEVHISYELQALPGGTVGFVATWRRHHDYVGRYLMQNDIVEIGPTVGGPVFVPVGGTLSLDSGAPSTSYTNYVETLTNMFNGRWDASGQRVGGVMGDAAPSFESRAGVRTRLTSPFLWELERERFGGPSHEMDYVDLNLPRVEGEPGFEMHIGATDMTADDDSFRAGFTYLFNPRARPDASLLRNDLYELSAQMFGYGGRGIHEMDDPLSRQRGEDHTRFLAAGDPRAQHDEADGEEP